MANQMLFERTEKKYLLRPAQYQALEARLGEWFIPDLYDRSTVLSLYYDTPNYQLIRYSLEKPVYKEKLRLRSYQVPQADTAVFLELKKKFDGVVYKRRVEMAYLQAVNYMKGIAFLPEKGQTAREIAHFTERYLLEAKALIACERYAFRGKTDPDLRATFDCALRWRDRDLQLASGGWGSPLLPEGEALLEIKASGALPIALVRLLSELQIFPCSYSKYGACYQQYLAETTHVGGGIICA